MTPRLGVAAATTVLALALALTACSGSDEPNGDGESDPGKSESSSPSASPAESQSPPSESPETPEVAPATGPVLKVKGMRVNAPEGWETTMRVAAGQSAFPLGQVGTTAGVNRFPNSGLYTTEELAGEELAALGRSGKRLDDLEIDGMQVYHLVGAPEKGAVIERFGTIAADQRVSLLFTFGNGEGGAEKDEIIQSMLATMQLG